MENEKCKMTVFPVDFVHILFRISSQNCMGILFEYFQRQLLQEKRAFPEYFDGLRHLWNRDIEQFHQWFTQEEQQKLRALLENPVVNGQANGRHSMYDGNTSDHAHPRP